MKSTTSSGNKFFSVFKNLLRRCAPIIGVLTVVSSLFTIGLLQIASVDFKIADGKSSHLFDLTDAFAPILMLNALLCIANGAMTIYTCLKEMYSKRGSDFFFAMPVKRSTYLNATYALTAVSSLISFAAQAVIISVFMLVNSRYGVSADAKSLMGIAVTLILIVLSAISVFMFCAMISGKMSQYAMFCAFTVLIGFLIATCAYCVNYVWGFWNDISRAGAIFSPLGGLIYLLKKQEFGFDLFVSVVSGVQAILFFALSQILFKKRKTEVAETTVSGFAFPLIMLALLQASIIMIITLIGYENLKITAIISIVFALLGTLGFGFKWFRRAHVKYVFISLAVVLALSCSFIYVTKNVSFNSYVNYVPEIGEVESAEVYETYGGFGMDGVFAEYLENDYETRGRSGELTSEEAISALINLHKKVANDEFKKNSDLKYGTWSVRFTYTLKNGKKVVRYYELPTNNIEEEFVSLMKTPDMIKNIYPMSLDDKDILFIKTDKVGVSDYDNPYDYYKADDYTQFKQAVAKDFVADDNQKNFLSRISYNNSYFYRYEYDVYVDEDALDTEIPAEDDFWGNAWIYSFTEDAPEEFKEKVRAMTPEEIMELYQSYNIEYAQYINNRDIAIYQTDKNMIELFENAKAVE